MGAEASSRRTSAHEGLLVTDDVEFTETRWPALVHACRDDARAHGRRGGRSAARSSARDEQGSPVGCAIPERKPSTRGGGECSALPRATAEGAAPAGPSSCPIAVPHSPARRDRRRGGKGLYQRNPGAERRARGRVAGLEAAIEGPSPTCPARPTASRTPRKPRTSPRRDRRSRLCARSSTPCRGTGTGGISAMNVEPDGDVSSSGEYLQGIGGGARREGASGAVRRCVLDRVLSPPDELTR